MTRQDTIEVVARAWAYRERRGRLYDRCAGDQGWERRFSCVEIYQSKARELLAEAGVIADPNLATPAVKEYEGQA